jgi:PIN domain nuclease of toxin-antitoxin system
MMSDVRYLLDAFGALAMMLGQSGSDRVLECVASSPISAVNLSEVVAKPYEGAVFDEAFMSSLAELNFDLLSFD